MELCRSWPWLPVVFCSGVKPVVPRIMRLPMFATMGTLTKSAAGSSEGDEYVCVCYGFADLSELRILVSELQMPSSRRVLPTAGLVGCFYGATDLVAFGDWLRLMMACPIRPAAPAMQSLSIVESLKVLLVV